MKAKVHPFEKHLSKPGKPYGVASAEDPQVSLVKHQFSANHLLLLLLSRIQESTNFNLSNLKFLHVILSRAFLLSRDICPSIWISSCSYWKFSCPHFHSILFVLLPPLLYFASVFFLHAVEFHHIPVVYFWEENWQFLSILILCSLFLAFFLNFIWNLHTQATSPLFWHPKCRKPGRLHRDT